MGMSALPDMWPEGKSLYIRQSTSAHGISTVANRPHPVVNFSLSCPSVIKGIK